MGVFFVYILKASVCLALFYLCYRVGLSKETFHRFNRITLLSLMVFSFLLPLVEVTVKDVPEVSQPFFSLEESMQAVVMDSGHDSDETSVHGMSGTLRTCHRLHSWSLHLVQQADYAGAQGYLVRQHTGDVER